MMTSSPTDSRSQVKVLFFSTLRELTGQNEVTRSLHLPADVSKLWEELKEDHPSLGSWDERVLIAVNLEYATLDHPLADGDEVAFMPPVQGG